MNTERNILTLAAVFIVAFFVFIIYVVYSAISGTIDGGKIALAFMILFFGFAGVAVVVVMLSARPEKKVFTKQSTELPKNSPMNYDKRETDGYCPICGANLGKDRPDICPECKERITRYL
jgi:hypothetical protein